MLYGLGQKLVDMLCWMAAIYTRFKNWTCAMMCQAGTYHTRNSHSGQHMYRTCKFRGEENVKSRKRYGVRLFLYLTYPVTFWNPYFSGWSRIWLNQVWVSKVIMKLSRVIIDITKVIFSCGCEWMRSTVPGCVLVNWSMWLTRMLLKSCMWSFNSPGFPEDPGDLSPGGTLRKRWALRPCLDARSYENG